MLKRIIMYGLYGLAVIALIVGIVIAFRAGKNTDKAPQVATSKPAQTQNGKTSSNSKPENKPTSNSTSNSTSTNSSSSSSSTSQAPSTAPAPSSSSSSSAATTPSAQDTQNGKLTNTGPGETALVFTGAVVAGSAAFSVYQRRKLAL